MTDLRDQIRDWWDEDALVYDGSPGHAMSDPVEAAAWRAVLERVLPTQPSRVLDVGAGTGAMSLLASELGHRVTALDVSERMLARARDKAESRGLDLTFVVGPAEDPPSGPFDAVIERHVAWTLPDPVATLRAWRAVVRPGGRLVLLEGSWAGEGPLVAVRDAAAALIERLRGERDHHHAPYPEAVRGSLPLDGATSPDPFVRVAREAGWERIRIARLRDVEWAIDRRQPWPLGALTHRPRFALVADAPA